MSGQARVNDDESTEVGWFDLDALPTMADRMTRCIADAVSTRVEPRMVAQAGDATG